MTVSGIAAKGGGVLTTQIYPSRGETEAPV